MREVRGEAVRQLFAEAFCEVLSLHRLRLPTCLGALRLGLHPFAVWMETRHYCEALDLLLATDKLPDAAHLERWLAGMGERYGAVTQD